MRDKKKDSTSNLIYLYVLTTNIYKDPVNQYQIKDQEVIKTVNIDINHLERKRKQ